MLLLLLLTFAVAACRVDVTVSLLLYHPTLYRSSSSSSSIFLYRSASQTVEAVDLLHNKTRRGRNTGLKNTYLPSECSYPAILRSIVFQEDDSRLFDRRSFHSSRSVRLCFLFTFFQHVHLEQITTFFFMFKIVFRQFN